MANATFDAKGDFLDAGASSYTISLTVAAQANRYLGVTFCHTIGQSITSVTANGQAMTAQLQKTSAGNANRSSVLYDLLNGPTGAVSIAITMSGAVAASGAAFSAYNVDQTSPRAGTSTSNGSSAAPALTVTGGSSSGVTFIFTGWRGVGSPTNTPDALWTTDSNRANASTCGALSHKTATSSDTRTDMLSGSADWAMVGVTLAAATDGGPIAAVESSDTASLTGTAFPTAATVGATESSDTAALTGTPLVRSAVYTTTFPLTENPISESSRWRNGATNGTAWKNMQTGSGNAYGVSFLAGFDDDVACITPALQPDQYIEGVVFKAGGYAPTSGHEIELHLRCTITSNNIASYEIDFPIAAAAAIVRWNGALNDFTNLTISGPNTTGLANGDVVRAAIVGSTITVWKNGSLILTATDSNITTGAPGIGAFARNENGDNVLASFGWASIEAGEFSLVLGQIAATESSDTAAIAAGTSSVDGSIATVESSDTASISAAATLPSSIAATESSDTAALTTTVTTGGSLAATESSDTTAISAAASTPASIAATESSDTASIAATVTTGAALAATDSSDATSLTSTVTTGGALAVVESSDTAVLTADETMTGQIAAVESSDTAALVTTVTTGASLAAGESSDTAAIVTNVIATAQLGATESSDTAAVSATVTIGATLACTEFADSCGITATNFGTGSIAANESSDVASIAVTVTTAATIAGTESADAAALVAQVVVGSVIAANESADTATVTATAAGSTQAAQVAATESGDTAALAAGTVIRAASRFVRLNDAGSRRPAQLSTGRRT